MEDNESNFGILTGWYTVEEKDEFIALLKPGDLIEFSRFCGIYEHWGVFAGKYFSSSSSDESYLINAGPSSRHWLNSHSQTESGTVSVDLLSAVWKNSEARINNQADYRWPPESPDIIIKRAESEYRQQQNYHLLTNNCEHFAKWCRNGVRESEEVTIGLTTTLTSACTFAVICFAGATTLAMKYKFFLGINDDVLMSDSPVHSPVFPRRSIELRKKDKRRRRSLSLD